MDLQRSASLAWAEVTERGLLLIFHGEGGESLLTEERMRTEEMIKDFYRHPRRKGRDGYMRRAYLLKDPYFWITLLPSTIYIYILEEGKDAPSPENIAACMGLR